MKNRLHEQVSTYYGKTIQSTEDLKTNACCTDVHNFINKLESIGDQNV